MRLAKYYFSTLASVAILVAPSSHAIDRISMSFSPAFSGPTELFGRPIGDQTNGNLTEIVCIYKSEATCRAVTLLEQDDSGNIMSEVSLILSKSYSVASLLSRDLGLDRVQFFQDQKGWNWSEKPKVLSHDKYAEARSHLLKIF